MPSQPTHGIFSWFFFLLFLAFFLPFCWYTFQSIRAVLTYEKTTGVIHDESYVPADVSSSSFSERPISRIGTYTHQAVFSTPDGKTFQVFTRVRSNPPPFKIGDRINVYYDAKSPSRALIGTFWELWFPPLALSFFALVFFVLWYGSRIGSLNGLPPTHRP